MMACQENTSKAKHAINMPNITLRLVGRVMP